MTSVAILSLERDLRELPESITMLSLKTEAECRYLLAVIERQLYHSSWFNSLSHDPSWIFKAENIKKD